MTDDTLTRARDMAVAGHSLAEVLDALKVDARPETRIGMRALWMVIVSRTNLSPTVRLIALAVGMMQPDRHTMQVTIQMGTLGKALHMGPGSIRSALGTLEHLGWLEPCGGHRSQGQRIYALRIPQQPVEGGEA